MSSFEHQSAIANRQHRYPHFLIGHLFHALFDLETQGVSVEISNPSMPPVAIPI
jgi:hypothetical protein